MRFFQAPRSVQVAAALLALHVIGTLPIWYVGSDTLGQHLMALIWLLIPSSLVIELLLVVPRARGTAIVWAGFGLLASSSNLAQVAGILPHVRSSGIPRWFLLGHSIFEIPANSAVIALLLSGDARHAFRHNARWLAGLRDPDQPSGLDSPNVLEAERRRRLSLFLLTVVVCACAALALIYLVYVASHVRHA